ncbi:hypothetical protein GCM10023324_01920 [Streptomyces youssoufiensis]
MIPQDREVTRVRVEPAMGSSSPHESFGTWSSMGMKESPREWVGRRWSGHDGLVR